MASNTTCRGAAIMASATWTTGAQPRNPRLSFRISNHTVVPQSPDHPESKYSGQGSHRDRGDSHTRSDRRQPQSQHGNIVVVNQEGGTRSPAPSSSIDTTTAFAATVR